MSSGSSVARYLAEQRARSKTPLRVSNKRAASPRRPSGRSSRTPRNPSEASSSSKRARSRSRSRVPLATRSATSSAPRPSSTTAARSTTSTAGSSGSTRKASPKLEPLPPVSSRKVPVTPAVRNFARDDSINDSEYLPEGEASYELYDSELETSLELSTPPSRGGRTLAIVAFLAGVVSTLLVSQLFAGSFAPASLVSRAPGVVETIVDADEVVPSVESHDREELSGVDKVQNSASSLQQWVYSHDVSFADELLARVEQVQQAAQELRTLSAAREGEVSAFEWSQLSSEITSEIPNEEALVQAYFSGANVDPKLLVEQSPLLSRMEQFFAASDELRQKYESMRHEFASVAAVAAARIQVFDFAADQCAEGTELEVATAAVTEASQLLLKRRQELAEHSAEQNESDADAAAAVQKQRAVATQLESAVQQHKSCAQDAEQLVETTAALKQIKDNITETEARATEAARNATQLSSIVEGLSRRVTLLRDWQREERRLREDVRRRMQPLLGGDDDDIVRMRYEDVVKVLNDEDDEGLHRHVSLPFDTSADDVSAVAEAIPEDSDAEATEEDKHEALLRRRLASLERNLEGAKDALLHQKALSEKLSRDLPKLRQAAKNTADLQRRLQARLESAQHDLTRALSLVLPTGEVDKSETDVASLWQQVQHLAEEQRAQATQAEETRRNHLAHVEELRQLRRQAEKDEAEAEDMLRQLLRQSEAQLRRVLSLARAVRILADGDEARDAVSLVRELGRLADSLPDLSTLD
ncbi:MAG: hypothetical protein MHM6MM_004032 [Cercozoa sp. M6MM]